MRQEKVGGETAGSESSIRGEVKDVQQQFRR
jgi:hypothetical protein